ncbi:hypothetical protein GT020_18790, partial [Glutamicibacter soli]
LFACVLACLGAGTSRHSRHFAANTGRDRMRGCIENMARVSALAGGAVLLALIAMTCLSVIGRAGLTLSALFDLPGVLGRLRPVRGDYELIEMGSAIAVFAFLPWCHLTRAHARVDLLQG